MSRKAVLYLENGDMLEGSFFGSRGECMGEVVFNTSMTGYEEIITDPSYCGQIVIMTYPQIGNYGINLKDGQGYGVWARGLAVREYTDHYSNWQAKMSLDNYLKKEGITAIEGLDTRSIVRKIREGGSMKGIISAVDFDRESLKSKLKKLPDMVGKDLVKEVNSSSKAAHKNFKTLTGSGPLVTVLDYGVKLSILENLKEQGFSINLIPGNSTLDQLLETEPSGVLFSNGPGDPKAVKYAVKLASELIDFNRKTPLPLMGICLGSQILALGAGAETYKLKFGHHGGNHPVKDLETGKIEITVQNHGFCVKEDSLGGEFVKTHINLNDNTVEGLRHRELPIISYQHHPEAGPGPLDSRYVFKKFREMINACQT